MSIQRTETVRKITTLSGILLEEKEVSQWHEDFLRQGGFCAGAYREFFVNKRRVHHWTYDRIPDETSPIFFTEKITIEDFVMEINQNEKAETIYK